MYPIFEIPPDAAELPEQLGTKQKFWYTQAKQSYLFKRGRPGTGENWAEKVACELCVLLGLPHAHYELACWKAWQGVITPSIVPHGGQLVHGNELLLGMDDDYPAYQQMHVKQHTVARIYQLMATETALQMPLQWLAPPSLDTPFAVFIGYLLLDAWIANQDRHHENWAFIVTASGELHLAATFDHASSLGRNESDVSRKERLHSKDKGRHISHYVTKARSALYTENQRKPLKTLEAFSQAADWLPSAAQFWLARLAALPDSEIEAIFARLPAAFISPLAVEFALSLLQWNRQRLLSSL